MGWREKRMANTENNKKGSKKPEAGAGAESKFCPNCGKQRKPDSAFCPECGFKLDAKVDTQQVVEEVKETAAAEETKAEKALSKEEIAPVPSETPPAKTGAPVDTPVAREQPPPVVPLPSNVPWYRKPLWVGCGIVGGVITIGLVTLIAAMGTCICLAPNTSSKTQTTTPSQLPASTGPTVEYFTASCPEQKSAGDTCNLSWSVKGPADTKVDISPDIGTVELSGMVKVPRGGTYIIKATSEKGISMRNVTVR
jgi:hypothetical protein